MAITVKHLKVSNIPDAGDDTLIEPSDWNADHQLTGTIPVANGGTGASTLTGYVKGSGTADLTASATIPSTDVTGLGTMSTQNSNNISVTGGSITGTTVAGYIPTSEKAQPLGVATLDAGGKVPTSQIPMQGDLNYQGTWNASTNTPTLVSSTGTKGYYYVVDVAGSTNLNGITDWNIGDWAIFNGSVWQKVDNTDAVTSVNGQVGTVVLTTTNIAEGTNLYYTDARARASNSAGTGISYDSATGVITNSLPSLGGDVVGPSSATDNAVARYDSTTGKLLQNSVVTVGDTGAVAGVTTLAASTSVTTPIVQATNSAGLALRNSAGTTQISMGGGGGDNVTIAVATNINGANAQIDISPTGTGHVHIKPTGTGSLEIAPTNVGTMDNITIGGTTPRAITGTTITATSFVGSGASLTNVVNSLTASTGISVSGSTGAVTVTNTAPDQTVAISSGTGISVSGTYPNFTVTNTAPSSGGTVTSVTGTSPIASSGGNTPAISISQANTSTNGFLSSTDWNTFNNKQPAGTYVNSVSATSPITSTGGVTPTIAMPAATSSVNGYLTSTDWTTFNSKGSGTVTSVGGTGTVSGISLSGTVTSSGNLTLGGTLNLSSPPAIGNTTPNTVAGTVIQATNGIVVNSNTVSASYTIPSGSSAMSAGPMTVASGQTVTVSSGSRWVIL
jgi:hypothetical protein